MKVKELIERLNRFNGEYDVIYNESDFKHATTRAITKVDTDGERSKQVILNR